MHRLIRLAPLLAIAPSRCFAHGEQAVLLPVGQIAALATVLVLTFVLKMTAAWRVTFIAAAAVVAVACWFIPNLYFVILDRFGTSGWPWFMLGLTTPILAALGVYAVFRRTSEHE